MTPRVSSALDSHSGRMRKFYPIRDACPGGAEKFAGRRSRQMRARGVINDQTVENRSFPADREIKAGSFDRE